MSVKPRRLDLARERDVLSTRDLGRIMGREALDSLGDAPELLLSFTGVEVASPPFLDEFLLSLRPLTHGGDTGRLLVVVGLNDDVRESLSMVLERRKLMLADLRDDQIDLLGGTEQLQRTLREAVDMGGHFTAPELAERLQIKLPALHQRLKTLTDSGVLARALDPTAERGVRHSYLGPTPDAVKRAAEEAGPPAQRGAPAGYQRGSSTSSSIGDAASRSSSRSVSATSGVITGAATIGGITRSAKRERSAG
jgi:DNA-binding MarR family transcriptional regulator